MQYLHHPSCGGLRRRLLLIQLSLQNSHVRPDSRFPDIASWHLDLHADPDLMCRKLVAERRLQVVFQDGIDERNGQRHFRPFSRRHFALWWQGALQCCSNGPTMYFVFLGAPRWFLAVFVFPTKSFVELRSVLQHFRWPIAFDVCYSQVILFESSAEPP